MTGRPDPEKLTAYALGELEGDEQANVEDTLREDPEARQAVEELRRAAALVTDALADVPAEGLTGPQREEIQRQAAAPAGRPWVRPLMMAAGILLVLGIGTLGIQRLMRAPGAESQPVIEEIPERFTEVKLAEQHRIQKELVEQTTAILQEDGVSGGTAGLATEKTVDAAIDGRLHALGYRRANKLDKNIVGISGLIADPSGIEAPRGHQTEAYDHVTDNTFHKVADEPLSTFSIDVDTASYSNVRRFLNGGSLPPAGAVRIEELINYFDYDYAPPTGDVPFATHVEVAGCPWAPDHRLVRVGLKGWELTRAQRPASNLVFLIDVSGSMQDANKLPLLREAMKLLVAQLDERDRVSMVVYAGSSGLVLDATPGDHGAEITGALDRLKAGGSTHGSAGIQQAYEVARSHQIDDGVNRVILATDGDFNVGTTSQSELVDLIEESADGGVFLTVLGFGMGNTKDSTMEKLADKGNGNYAYIDTLNEANKVLVEQMTGTLVTIAKDVKIQVEFNPLQAQAYRLIGYENRVLANEDFNDDTVDAGEIGAGHTVTALYEVVPAGINMVLPGVDPLRYQQPPTPSAEAAGGDLLTLKLRYKEPDGFDSTRLEFPVRDDGTGYARASTDFKFAASVAMFGMLLRDSPYKGTSTYGAVLELADEGRGRDRHGYRAEFLQLVGKASRL